MRAKISHINVFVPERRVTSAEVEATINASGNFIAAGSLERLFGVQERRYADADVQVSDLAVNAAAPLVAEIGKSNIDCLIFASACSDLIEPATANIVQHKLGLHCPSFDVKNACNSFVTALQVASSFIVSGTYNRVLIATGEKLSNAIKTTIASDADLKNRLAALSFGDAGSAVVVERSTDESGIYHQSFLTSGKHWELCTIQGGGSLFPFDSSKNYFTGRTSELSEVMFEEGGAFVSEAFQNSGWQLHDVDHFFTHQVSAKTFEMVAQYFGIPENKFHKVISEYGNTASASIPLAMERAIRQGQLRKGDKVAIIGLAAGISISVQLIQW